jgi:hypothetical protein
MRLAIFAMLAACSSGEGGVMHEPDAALPSPDARDGVEPDAHMAVDLDGDGLDDHVEQQLAAAYVPFLSIDPGDGCPLSGLVARVRPHPSDPTKILIVYSHLFQRDCGFLGHIGDNEAFGIAIDPSVPAPAGLLAIKTASHQGTPCERISECTTCANDSRSQCDLAMYNGVQWPVLYASKDKHGQYATKATCSAFGTCFDSCTLASAPQQAPVLDVGEPGHALVHDLTVEGFITSANGWTEPTLMNFDPWDTAHDFGGAGNIADDLQDTTFEPAPCAM